MIFCLVKICAKLYLRRIARILLTLRFDLLIKSNLPRVHFIYQDFSKIMVKFVKIDLPIFDYDYGYDLLKAA